MNALPRFARLDATSGALAAATFTAAASGDHLKRLEDRQFLQMRTAFDRTGGLISGEGVAHRLRRYVDQPLSTLARWIVARTIVSLEWRSHILVPMFQFEPSAMTPRDSVVDVMGELKDVLDDWETALWFAQPNTWLDNRAPVDMIVPEPAATLEAAQADRFIAKG